MAESKNTNLTFFITLLVLFGAVYLWFLPPREEPVQKLKVPIPEAGQISIKGIMVCLPHRDTSGPQTIECAYGLRDNEDRYFALRDTDPTYRNLSNQPMNVYVEVKGMFTPEEDDIYQSIGVIDVTEITLAGVSD